MAMVYQNPRQGLNLNITAAEAGPGRFTIEILNSAGTAPAGSPVVRATSVIEPNGNCAKERNTS